MSVPLGVRGPLWKFGHITPSPRRTRSWSSFTRGLGFRVSDALAVRLTLAALRHGPPRVAFGAGGTHRLHNCAFELTGWGAMRDFLDRLSLGGGWLAYGPGVAPMVWRCTG